MAYASDNLKEAAFKGRSSYTAPALNNAGGSWMKTEIVTNGVSSLTSQALTGYKVKFTWSHYNLSGDVYRVQSDETGTWVTLQDDIAVKEYTRTWTDRKQANYRVFAKRNGQLSDPNQLNNVKTNTRVAGTFKDSSNNPISNAEIHVWREDTNTKVGSGTTDAQGKFDIELDDQWPYNVTVFSEGKPSSGINGGIASGISA